MVLRVKPTPTRFPTNSLYSPMDNTPLHFIQSVCHPLGRDAFVTSTGSAITFDNDGLRLFLTKEIRFGNYV